MKKQILKYSVLITLFFFFGSFAFSSTVYFSPKIGLKNGIVREYLFTGSHKLSQLDWNVQNQIDIGFETDFFVENLYFGFDFSVGLYNFSGFMEDRDWKNSSSDLTNYSWHNLVVKEDIDFSFDIGIIFPWEWKTTKNQFKKNHGQENYISAFFQFNLKSSTYDGVQGWYDYKEPNMNGTFEDYGKVISYNPSIVSLLIGFGANINVYKNFSVRTGVSTSFLSSGICIDNHWIPGDKWVDSVAGAFFLKGFLDLSYNFNDKNALVLGGKINYLPPIFGECYVNNILSSLIGGFSSFSYEFYLSYRIRIL